MDGESFHLIQIKNQNLVHFAGKLSYFEALLFSTK